MADHRGNFPRTWRLLLSRMLCDSDAEQTVFAEIGDCPQCLCEMVDTLADHAVTGLVFAECGFDHSVEYVQDMIAGSLDACALDERAVARGRFDSGHQKQEKNMTDWPIAVVAAELGCGTRDIEKRCNDRMVRNADGLRCVPGDMVRAMVEQRDEQVARQREQSRLAQRNAELPPARQRVRAIQARQAENSLETADLSLPQSALARIKQDEHLQRLDKAAQRFDEYKTGEVHMHRINHNRNGE